MTAKAGTQHRSALPPRLVRLVTGVEPDLLFINLWSVALLISASAQLLSPVQLVLGFPFVVFFPGYVVLKILFSEKELNGVERVALSFGLSMLIVPVLGAILAYGLQNISVYSTITCIYIFIAVSTILAQYSPRFSVNARMKSLINVNKAGLILPFVLISFLAMFIRFYPSLDLSLLPGHWQAANHLYPVFYTVETGHLLETAPFDPNTPFSAAVFNFLHNRGFLLFEIPMFLAMGATDLNEVLRLNRFFPWPGAVLIPLTALLVADPLWSERRKSVGFTPLFLVYLLAAFFSTRLLAETHFITSNLALSYALLFIATYFLLTSRDDTKRKLLSLIFAIAIFLYYRTAGIAFLFVIFVAIVFQLLMKRRILPAGYAAFYVTSFSAYYVFAAHGAFREFVLNLKLAIQFPGATALQQGSGRGLIDLESLAHLAAFANVVLIGLMLSLFVIFCLSHRKNALVHTKATNVMITLSLGVLTLGLIFLAWNGIKEAALRITVFLMFPTVLALALLLAAGGRKWALSAGAISLLIVISSILAYVPGTVMLQPALTYTEARAVEWFCDGDRRAGFAFTDFRIGAAANLIDNCDQFTGIRFGRKDNAPAEDFKNVYYSANPTDTTETLDKYSATYLLLGERMQSVGIASASNYYRPGDEDSVAKFENSGYFSKVYNNGGAVYYYYSRLYGSPDVLESLE